MITFLKILFVILVPAAAGCFIVAAATQSAMFAIIACIITCVCWAIAPEIGL